MSSVPTDSEPPTSLILSTYWLIVAKWIDPKTRNKIRFIAPDEVTYELTKDVDAKLLPCRYGGLREEDDMPVPGIPGEPAVEVVAPGPDHLHLGGGSQEDSKGDSSGGFLRDSNIDDEDVVGAEASDFGDDVIHHDDFEEWVDDTGSQDR